VHNNPQTFTKEYCWNCKTYGSVATEVQEEAVSPKGIERKEQAQ